MSSPYQLFPDLSPEEFQGLKKSIAERGVLTPIEKDEHGNILDGHHRLRAVEELRAESYDVALPAVIIRAGLSEADIGGETKARRRYAARRHDPASDC